LRQVTLSAAGPPVPHALQPRTGWGILVAMLIVKCAACRRKLWKYLKIGKGEVLRCHKDRITRLYEAEEREGKIYCLCGKPVGIDKGGHYSMIRNAFTYAGTKEPK